MSALFCLSLRFSVGSYVACIYLRTNSSNSEPSTLAPSAGGTPFGNLGQAIEAFQNGANIAAPKSTTQLITSSDISCHEMQSDDGPLIWSRLCLDSRKVTRGGFTLGKRLSLAASWICAVKSARGRIQTTSSLRDATFDIHSIEKLDLAVGVYQEIVATCANMCAEFPSFPRYTKGSGNFTSEGRI